MAQNIYDTPAFFEGYSRLGRSVDGLAGAAEWPSLRALIPGLHGLRVVDLGCGFGWFCRWAAGQGAAQVLGLDVSENMLARARSATTEAAVSYVRADLDNLALPDAGFDFAYSALALHYVEDIAGLLARLHRALVPGARVVFSVEHPIYMAPSAPGWLTDAAGRKTWPVDGYSVEGVRTTNWLADGVIKHHRSIGTWINTLLAQGFTISHVEEWAPTDAQIAARPELAEERERPMFLLLAAQRSG
ncbi:bifunctional 2-polyprenyl-6-hydroxyphenol methylase/3-demethylubiquinol 3-O-methyltransferase UbiG [Jeongeupia sp. USM3]|uniref:class I SAM-dependent methyltransferase n=1 Tax=Jeongeupia sp. USM3 TaxID=1906741 RepID=UPI00089DD6DD|nr:class I SAM-dependent methyltransferase [Jeongeupia sp. USM3]AOX99603.1 SAM-dependent methyltransferase [Jeongeupia sp. USM3]